jgi:hypothetical protein
VCTGRYQATHVPSRDRCIATILHATLLSRYFQLNSHWFYVSPNFVVQEKGSKVSVVWLFEHRGENKRYFFISVVVSRSVDIYIYVISQGINDFITWKRMKIGDRTIKK